MNQPGAGGLIAARALASSAPDGYTLFMAASSVFVSLPELQSNLPFDVSDFVPIGYIGEQPFALGVAASLPINSVDEFIAYSKKSPEGLNTVAGTQGGLQHVSLEWFRARSSANLTMVHYPSTAAAMNDVISGRVPVIWDAVTSLSGPVAAGQIKLLAVTSAKRAGHASANSTDRRHPSWLCGLGLACLGRPQGSAKRHRAKAEHRSARRAGSPGAAKEVRGAWHLHAPNVVTGACEFCPQRTGHVAAHRAANPELEALTFPRFTAPAVAIALSASRRRIAKVSLQAGTPAASHPR